jgi:Tol biopolymer transport system component
MPLPARFASFVIAFLACACGPGPTEAMTDGGHDAGVTTDGETTDGGDADGAPPDGAADLGQPLTLDPLANAVAIPGTDLGPIALGIDGPTTSTPAISVTGTSIGTPSPVTLAPSVFGIGGSGLSRTLTISGLTAAHAGSYTITVTVQDGVASASRSFTLRVNAAPALGFIADTGTLAGYALPTFGVSVYDDCLAPETLLLEAASSNETFLPAAGITLSTISGSGDGSGGFQVTLVPATSGVGEAQVTITATDPEGASDSRTFQVEITSTSVSGVELISRSAGVPATGGSGPSLAPTVSGDGQIVVFTSQADNLAGGMPSAGDLFVRDRSAGTTTRLGIQGESGGAVITANGRFVAFTSRSASLAGGDTNAVPDVFVYDRVTATFERVSVSSGEAHANGPSSIDPSYVGAPFRRVGISDDGRFVLFESDATNLVANDTNGVTDVFLRDRTLGTTTRVSVSSSGVEADGPSGRVALSGDGSTIAFASLATNLVDGMAETDAHDDVYIRAAGTTVRASSAALGGAGNGASTSPSLSSTGRYLVYASAATNLLPSVEFFGKVDLYLLDRDTGVTTRVNFDLAGVTQGNCASPVISGDGDRVAFVSDVLFPEYENDLLNAYVFERSTMTFSFVGGNLVGGAPNGGTGYSVSIAAGGELVVFQSAASNLFPGDDNVAIDVFAQPVP